MFAPFRNYTHVFGNEVGENRAGSFAVWSIKYTLVRDVPGVL